MADVVLTFDTEQLVDTVLELREEIRSRPPLPDHLSDRIDAIVAGTAQDVIHIEGFTLSAGPELLSILAAIRAQPVR